MVKLLAYTCLVLIACLIVMIIFLRCVLEEKKNKKIKDQAQQIKKENDVINKTVEGQKKIDELLEKTDGSCNTPNFINSNDMLRELSEKGQRRNKTD